MQPVSIGVERIFYSVAVYVDIVLFGYLGSLVPGGSLYLE